MGDLMRYWATTMRGNEIVPVDLGPWRCRWWKRKHRTTLAAHMVAGEHDLRVVFCQRCGRSYTDTRKLLQLTGWDA